MNIQTRDLTLDIDELLLDIDLRVVQCTLLKSFEYTAVCWGIKV